MNVHKDLGDKFVGGVFTLIGIGLLIFGIIDYYQAKSSTSWESVPGKILKSTVEKRRNEDGGIYEPIIVYSYKIKKKRYQSRTVYFGESLEQTSLKFSQELVSKFPVSTQVNVYYNPKSPSNSILLTGVTNGNYKKILIGIGFMIVGVFIVKNKLDKENI